MSQQPTANENSSIDVTVKALGNLNGATANYTGVRAYYPQTNVYPYHYYTQLAQQQQRYFSFQQPLNPQPLNQQPINQHQLNPQPTNQEIVNSHKITEINSHKAESLHSPKIESKHTSKIEAINARTPPIMKRPRYNGPSCKRCKRTNHHTLDCFAIKDVDGSSILPCTCCGATNHWRSQCPHYKNPNHATETSPKHYNYHSNSDHVQKANHKRNSRMKRDPRKHYQLRRPNRKSSTKSPLTLPDVLKTTNIIQWPLGARLLELKRKHDRNIGNEEWFNKIFLIKTGIKGLVAIGKYLWIRHLHDTKEYHKVKAYSFIHFMEWIPKQNREYIDVWRKYASSFNSESDLTSLLTNKNKSNASRLFVINQFKNRLIYFMNAIKTLYASKESSKNDNYDKYNTCKRCGRLGSHTADVCHAKQHVNGSMLNGTRAKYNNKNATAHASDAKYCRYGKNCKHISDCRFLHRHKMLCPYGPKCRKGVKCEWMHAICSTGTNVSITPQKRTHQQMSIRDDEYIEEAPLKKRKIDYVHTETATGMKIKKENADEYNPYINQHIIDDTKAEKVMMNCANCNSDLKHKDLWRCSSCKSVYYCGRECQSKHWKIHKTQCGIASNDGKSSNIKIERVHVNDWSCYSIVYWFNRLLDGKFRDIKYMDLRQHIVIGKLKGSDLVSVNAVMLRMMGIYDAHEQDVILNAISDVLTNNNYSNTFANTMNVDHIPPLFMDPSWCELMPDPVRIKKTGFRYERSFVTKHIAENRTDPMTKEGIEMQDIVECRRKSLKQDIANWIREQIANNC